MKKILGFALLAVVIGGLFTGMALSAGFLVALGIWAAAIVFAALIVAGVYLITA